MGYSRDTMMSRYCLLLAVAATLASSVRGTAEVMSHVTAHFGKALEECREEVRNFES